MAREIGQSLYDRYRKLLTGELKPWQLPEFQGLERQLSLGASRTRQAMGPQLQRMGIRGPAAAMAMQKAGETGMAPAGEYIRGLYGQIPQQAMGIESWATDLEKFAQQMAEARKQRKSQEKIAKMQGITSGFTSLCILAAACYGSDSPAVEFLRFYRDWIVPRKIVRGYYVFSDIILPLMRFRLVKTFVEKGIVDPLLRAGAYWVGFGKKGFRLPFDMAISISLLKFWRILGSRGSYRRRNGEII